MTEIQKPPGLNTVPFAQQIRVMGASLPRSLQEKLEEARQSDKYMVAVWTYDDNGVIDLYRYNSKKFQYNWFLRSLKMLEKMLLSIDLPEEPKDVDTKAVGNG